MVAGGVVYAPFSSGELMAINGDSGSTLWEQVLAHQNRTNALSEIRWIFPAVRLSSRARFSPPAIPGVFQAMDITTGEPAWKINTDSVNTPWVAGDVVFLVDLQGELICGVNL